ncbi:Peptidoglycan-binding LysM [Psychromonas ingrahamii 37]|uniref:Peptidoglycan-binding LysM n=1 Tax=Psychromonas ingrahamii (strain DSM 17664 / CCUG 51855 / 37) TaxID=357804 RepID=A1SR36_PSYIN|nr:LysM peptidoglycan-binding domain-containing protein [Psychromonas ingrahamii]ABM01951.1 Peptidoglycan-binding LysM [Psychromonas ingrahamii 37]
MKLNLITAFLIGIVVSVVAIADTLTLKDNHPETYEVVKGDTLWDISAHFLNSPWLWPRLWQKNSQIKNPDLIYPGDILTLIWVDGEPQLSRKILKKLSPTPRLQEKQAAIPTIPLASISSFLSRDHIIDPALLTGAPRLLGDGKATPRFFEGDIFYGQGQYDKGKLYGVYRLGEDYIDSVSKEFLGKQLIFIGLSEVSKNPNVSGTEQVTPHDFISSSREARQGDLILPIPEYETLPAYFLPQSVPKTMQGQIIAALNNSKAAGKWDIVVINKGQRDNVQIGSMFSILRSGPGILINKNSVVYQKYASKLDQIGSPDIKIPAERIGELLVFRVYDKVSIAMIMRSTEVIAPNYKIQGLAF